MVGCVGAVGVRSIAWWEGSTTWGVVHASLSASSAEGSFRPSRGTRDKLPPYARTGEVDMVDGFVLGLSPWTVRNVRFDESLGLILHGYDFDFCLQVRAAGRKVVTIDAKVVHHHSLELVSDPETYDRGAMKIAEKWHGTDAEHRRRRRRLEPRARRAEAEAAAARAQAISAQLEIDARERRQEREFEEMINSTSWRITAPLRRLKTLRRAGRPRQS